MNHLSIAPNLTTNYRIKTLKQNSKQQNFGMMINKDLGTQLGNLNQEGLNALKKMGFWNYLKKVTNNGFDRLNLSIQFALDEGVTIFNHKFTKDTNLFRFRISDGEIPEDVDYIKKNPLLFPLDRDPRLIIPEQTNEEYYYAYYKCGEIHNVSYHSLSELPEYIASYSSNAQMKKLLEDADTHEYLYSSGAERTMKELSELLKEPSRKKPTKADLEDQQKFVDGLIEKYST